MIPDSLAILFWYSWFICHWFIRKTEKKNQIKLCMLHFVLMCQTHFLILLNIISLNESPKLHVESQEKLNKWYDRPTRTYSCLLVTWPLDDSEARVDLVLIQTWLMHQVSIRTTCFTQQMQWGLYQNKANSSLAVIQRPGHWADNCKMVYCGSYAF